MRLSLCSALAALVLALFLGSAPLAAQRGSGAPGAVIRKTAAPLGGTLRLEFGLPGVAGAATFLLISDGFGPARSPVLGVDLFLDVLSPSYQILPYTAGASGEITLALPIVNDPALVGAPPIFGASFVVDPSLPAPGWSMSKTIRVDFDTVDGFRPAGTLLSPRANHTATLLSQEPGDSVSEVLVTGGNTGSFIIPFPTSSTEIWSPVTRQFRPGPTMATERTFHTATQLEDGRVLLAGGTQVSGMNTASAEIFDPITETFTSVAPMNTPRSAHRASLLPDGRVLVTGGFGDWQSAATQFVNVLNTALDTAEIYDPNTGLWTQLPVTMFSARGGHGHTTLADGRVLLTGGVRGGSSAGGGFPGGGGQIAIFSNDSDLFDPQTDTFTRGPNLTTPIGFHGATTMIDPTQVMLTGGLWAGGTSGASIAGSTVMTWDGQPGSNFLNSAVTLPRPVGFHTATRSLFNGDTVIMGGVTGDLTQLDAVATTARHNGTFMLETLVIGSHNELPSSSVSDRSNHTMTALQDGSYLLIGGTDWPTTFSEAWTVTEPN